MLEALFTIGVYGSSEALFFGKLESARIDTFCDIRQRRAVRGAAYAFANSSRLQTALAAKGILYRHVLELTPTTAMREAQYRADAEAGVSKRAREQLGDTFRYLYHRIVLAKFDSQAFLQSFPPASRRVVLFCVEASAAACHRSLVADRLAKDWAIPLVHL